MSEVSPDREARFPPRDPLGGLPPAAVALFDSAFNATSGGVLIVDLQDRPIYHNRLFASMWRLPAPLAVGRDGNAGLEVILEQVVDPDGFLRTVRHLAATPEAESDALIALKGGQWYEGRSQPQRLDGEVIGRVWWFRDVTERHQMLGALQQSEERFTHLFLASPISILLATYPEGRIVDVNPAFSRLFERERAEVIGRTTHEISLWADATDRDRMLGELRAGQGLKGMEFTFTTRAGDPRVVLLSIELVQLQGQWHSLASSVDVTGQKVVEAALRESELRYRTLFEAVGETIYLLSEGGIFLALNHAFEVATGWPRAEWLGRSFVDLVHPDDATRALDMFRRAVGGESGRLLDLRLRHRNGEWIIAECSSASPVVEDGRVAGFLGTGRDVTQQRQLEENARQAQKIEALGTLAGGIAHDFNNILAAIVGHSEHLRERLAGQPELEEEVAGIWRATTRAKALVRQVLTFSRQQPEERRIVALAPLVREAMGLLRATLPSTIMISAEFVGPDAVILADPSQVHQVIVNLGTNAVHAMVEAGGTLRIEQGVVDVGPPDAGPVAGVAPGRYLRLRVSDTGPGMSPATLRRVFDPFFTTKGPTEGTGLGLAVVHGIMRSHEGAITIESRPGAGTTATLYFPHVAGSAPAAPSEPTAPPQGRGERIMLVDDEVALVDLGTRLLTRLGYRARGYRSAEAALAAFVADPAEIDLLLTDLTMPGMAGSELARQMLARRPDLPVILTTGYAGALGPEELAGYGIRELVSKPFDLHSVAEAVARCLRRDRL